MREQLNCPNCGAPINGTRCEYCGTQFFDLADIELFKAGYLQMKIDDKMVLCEAIPTYISVEHSYATAPQITVNFLVKQQCNDVYFIVRDMKKGGGNGFKKRN